MSFNYFDALNEDRDKVRLETGDTQCDAGPRPDKRNFSDQEVAYYLSDEGSVNGAIARIFETLKAEWTPFSISEREGEASYDAKDMLDKFTKLANDWRAVAGGGANTIYAGVVGLDIATRGDDYPSD